MATPISIAEKLKTAFEQQLPTIEINSSSVSFNNKGVTATIPNLPISAERPRTNRIR